MWQGNKLLCQRDWTAADKAGSTADDDERDEDVPAAEEEDAPEEEDGAT